MPNWLDSIKRLGGLFPPAKVPKGAIKSAGEALSGIKKTPAGPAIETPTTSGMPATDIPFSGLYDITVAIESAAFEFADSKFVPGTMAHGKVHLEGNGHPLVLPLDKLHPGFSESMALEVFGVFQGQKVKVAAFDNAGCQVRNFYWSGTCVSDGSGFHFPFVVFHDNLESHESLRGYIEGVRSKS